MEGKWETRRKEGNPRLSHGENKHGAVLDAELPPKIVTVLRECNLVCGQNGSRIKLRPSTEFYLHRKKRGKEISEDVNERRFAPKAS